MPVTSEAQIAENLENTAKPPKMPTSEARIRANQANSKLAQEEVNPDANAQAEEMMGSFFQTHSAFGQMDAEFDSLCDELEKTLPPEPANSPSLAAMAGMIDLPIAKTPRR